MLENLSHNLNQDIRDCLQHAEDCAREAREQFDPGLREDFLDTARRWLCLARHELNSTMPQPSL
jgi:hypothetical protein